MLMTKKQKNTDKKEEKQTTTAAAPKTPAPTPTVKITVGPTAAQIIKDLTALPLKSITPKQYTTILRLIQQKIKH